MSVFAVLFVIVFLKVKLMSNKFQIQGQLRFSTEDLRFTLTALTHTHKEKTERIVLVVIVYYRV